LTYQTITMAVVARADSGLASPTAKLGDLVVNLALEFGSKLKGEEVDKSVYLATSFEDNLKDIVRVHQDVEHHFLRLVNTFEDGTVCNHFI